MRASTENQVLTRSRSGSPGNQFFYKRRGFPFAGTRRADKIASVHKNVFRAGNSSNNLLKRKNLSTSQHGRQHGFIGARCLLQNTQFFGGGWVLNDDVEHETIQLGFRQRVGAFLFDRILSRQSEKWVRKIVRVRTDSDVTLLHRLQKCGLGLGRRSIDFVRQQNVSKQWSLNELKDSSASFRVILQNIGPGYVGRHQVRSKLDSSKRKLQDAGNSAAEQRLRQAGYAD